MDRNTNLKVAAIVAAWVVVEPHEKDVVARVNPPRRVRLSANSTKKSWSFAYERVIGRARSTRGARAAAAAAISPDATERFSPSWRSADAMRQVEDVVAIPGNQYSGSKRSGRSSCHRLYSRLHVNWPGTLACPRRAPEEIGQVEAVAVAPVGCP